MEEEGRGREVLEQLKSHKTGLTTQRISVEHLETHADGWRKGSYKGSVGG